MSTPSWPNSPTPDCCKRADLTVQRASAWQGRAATAEAAILLVVARLLIARVGFGRWRAALGQAVMPPSAGAPDGHHPGNGEARRLAASVMRAAARVPGESKCLAQAIALQWMLRRRKLGATLIIGARPHQRRGGLTDLHAWVVRCEEILIGESDEPHHPIYAARFESAQAPVC